MYHLVETCNTTQQWGHTQRCQSTHILESFPGGLAGRGLRLGDRLLETGWGLQLQGLENQATTSQELLLRRKINDVSIGLPGRGGSWAASWF